MLLSGCTVSVLLIGAAALCHFAVRRCQVTSGLGARSFPCGPADLKRLRRATIFLACSGLTMATATVVTLVTQDLLLIPLWLIPVAVLYLAGTHPMLMSSDVLLFAVFGTDSVARRSRVDGQLRSRVRVTRHVLWGVAGLGPVLVIVVGMIAVLQLHRTGLIPP